jgi:predicted dehydrogenase
MGDARALRAVVVGAGWAAEGHVRALQGSGVHVAAICARRAEVVRAVADRLQVPGASTDWRAAIHRVRPEIVTIATPATLRLAVVEEAVGLGCHLLCEKPLAATAGEALAMYRLVARGGAKHAYGATHVYDPGVRWLAELVRGGTIGPLRAIDGTFRAARRRPQEGLRPWTWADSLAAGGGMLNLGFTHQLAIPQTVTGMVPRRVAGEVQWWGGRAPLAGAVHDSRDFRRGLVPPVAPGQAAQPEWRERDVEAAYAALIRFGRPPDAGKAPAGGDAEVLVNVVAWPGAPAWPADGWRLFGRDGTLVAQGRFELRVARATAEGTLEALPVPVRLDAALPRATGDDGEHLNQSKWNALVRDFVADGRDEPHGAYPTFADGWRIQAVIDAIRAGREWTEIPDERRITE